MAYCSECGAAKVNTPIPDNGQCLACGHHPLNPAIIYQSEHGEAPELLGIVKLHPTWYWADEGFYTPHPQMVSRGVNDAWDFLEDEYSLPAVLVQNTASERYYIIVFDFYDVNNNSIKIWDNGDNTFKFYITNGNTATWCAASVEVDGFPTEKPTFEELTSLMSPVKGSCTSDGVNSSHYMFDNNGEIGIDKNNRTEKCDWKIIWASDFVKDHYSGYDYGYTPEPSEPYYALIPGGEESLPTMEADGYIFKGWSLSGEIVEGNYPIDSDVTLTAVWEEAPEEPDAPTTVDYTITYSTAHGSAPASKTVTVNEGESYSLTEADLPDLEAEGYIFKGWVDAAGNVVEVGHAVSGDIVLTAVWEEIPVEPEEPNTDTATYRWEVQNNALVSVGVNDNDLTRITGSIVDGVFQVAQYSLAKSFNLIHDKDWALEFRMKFARKQSPPMSKVWDDGGKHSIVVREQSQSISICERDSSHIHYGVKLEGYGIDLYTEHLYRLQNRVNADGTNMVYLYVDGEKVAPMNDKFSASSDLGIEDRVSGLDLSFGYMGANSYTVDGFTMSDIAVWESGADAVFAPTTDDTINITVDRTSFLIGYVLGVEFGRNGHGKKSNYKVGD